MNEVAWIWSIAAFAGVILLAFAVRFIARRVEVIEDAIKGLADDVDENDGEHKLQLIGASEPSPAPSKSTEQKSFGPKDRPVTQKPSGGSGGTGNTGQGGSDKK